MKVEGVTLGWGLNAYDTLTESNFETNIVIFVTHGYQWRIIVVIANRNMVDGDAINSGKRSTYFSSKSWIFTLLKLFNKHWIHQLNYWIIWFYLDNQIY